MVVLRNLQALLGNYAKLYALVTCIELIQVLLALAVFLEWDEDLFNFKDAFMHAKQPEMGDVCVKLLRYSIQTLEHGPFIKSNSIQPLLEAYSDANWAQDDKKRL